MKTNEAFLMHGEYLKIGDRKQGNERDAYVCFIKSVETGEVEMKIIENPEVSVYVTKPQFRTNTIKKECELKSHCDMYRTHLLKMNETLFNAINNPGKFRPVYGYLHPKKLLSNPYVYGADIDYGVHLKYAYNKANGNRSPKEYNVGHLDIETDVNDTEDIILITFINGDGKTYVGVLKEFFKSFHPTPDKTVVADRVYAVKKPHTKDTYLNISDVIGHNPMPGQSLDDIKFTIAKKFNISLDRVVIYACQEHTFDEARALWTKTEREFRDKLNDKVQKMYDKMEPLDIVFKLCDTEVDLIKWIFDRIHEHKPDFVTIWNIAFDIPYILDRLAFRGVDPKDVFCHPDVPKQWRCCQFHLDKGKKDSHITDLWSWLHCTDYTCFIDGMCLYGRLRKAKGRDSSYKLNDIGTKEIGAGKLEFGDGEGHSIMQSEHPVEYTVYNIVDVLILRVMERKNNDIFNMVMLSDVSTLDEFHHQSVQLKNSFYAYLDKVGKIPGSVGDPLEHPWDKYIHNKGGAVLDPERSVGFTPGITVPCLEESDDIGRAARFVLDEDVSSMYPSALNSFNITRETKLATMLHIDNTRRAGKVVDVEKVMLDPNEVPGLINYRVQDFCVNAIYVEANAMYVAKMFGLPSFDGVDQFIRENHPEMIPV